jgi:hypothetical protein
MLGASLPLATDFKVRGVDKDLSSVIKMISHRDLAMSQEHYWDLRREADKERLIQQARMPGTRTTRLHGRVLSWLGRQMVAWGQSLQMRYGTTATLITRQNS